jgi:pentatricopeptide repeat protein
MVGTEKLIKMKRFQEAKALKESMKEKGKCRVFITS